MYKLARKIQLTKRGIKRWSLDKRSEWNGEWDKFESDLLEAQLALEDDGNAEEFIRIRKDSNVAALKHILDIYCRASSQVINQSKSTLLASLNSKEEDVNRFSEILGISKSSNFGVYLGILAYFGTTKKEIFGFMVDRVKERLNAWNSMFLSHAGRLTLIKSVLSCLGTYVLSVFKCPMGILKKDK
uniref:Uncharacterized protein n=1 Tax=Chenopodium quinoa TaxID=63459 RepID=A0A803MHW8_CHEQI